MTGVKQSSPHPCTEAELIMKFHTAYNTTFLMQLNWVLVGFPRHNSPNNLKKLRDVLVLSTVSSTLRTSGVFCKEEGKGGRWGEISPAVEGPRKFSSFTAGLFFFFLLFSHRQDQLSISDVELCGGTADVGNKNLWPLSSFKEDGCLVWQDEPSIRGAVCYQLTHEVSFSCCLNF